MPALRSCVRCGLLISAAHVCPPLERRGPAGFGEVLDVARARAAELVPPLWVSADRCFRTH